MNYIARAWRWVRRGIENALTRGLFSGGDREL